MFEIIKFLFTQVISILKMLFNLDVGGHSYGTILSIVFIFFPVVLAIIHFVKTTFVEEIDDRIDENRPREIFQDTYSRPVKFSDGSTVTTRHTISRKRRYRRR